MHPADSLYELPYTEPVACLWAGCCRLEAEVASLETHLDTVKATYMLNADKLDYNYRVLGKPCAGRAQLALHCTALHYPSDAHPLALVSPAAQWSVSASPRTP